MAKRSKKQDPRAPLGLEAQLWAAADALRNNMDAAEYKHVVLGLIFLKYISDAFDSKHVRVLITVKTYLSRPSRMTNWCAQPASPSRVIGFASIQ